MYWKDRLAIGVDFWPRLHCFAQMQSKSQANLKPGSLALIDVLTTLAVSMHTKKATYALLVGSGISQASQIPTGWDIVLDLIRKVAAASGDECGDAPEAWYETKFGMPADYSVLLHQLTQTPAERSQIIRQYIEPDEEQRELGLRVPTDAHRAIADLVSSGYVRVIVTTNFDRLLEIALSDVGIVPTVIGTSDGVLGSLPLVHNNCTLVKVNGDYVDVRIKNTAVELERYLPPFNRLLDQILYEYGVVVCGWSGDWDTGLVAAMKRKKSPWFGTFWSTRSAPKQAAAELIELRRGKVITDMDADGFFTQLRDRIQALEATEAPETISVATMTNTVKRYIDDPTKRIRLHDLVIGEASRVQRAIVSDRATAYAEEFTPESIESRFERYERATDTIRAVLGTGCYWGNVDHAPQWTRAIERLCDLPLINQGGVYEDWLKLRYYPALLALYAAGIAATASQNFETLRSLIYDTTVMHQEYSRRAPLVTMVHAGIMSDFLAKTWQPTTISGAVLPLRIRETQRLWPVLREYLPEDDRFQDTFNRFEYLLGLTTVDIKIANNMGIWAPSGLLPYKNHGYAAKELIGRVEAEIAAAGTAWPPLAAGMFGGSVEQLRIAKDRYDKDVNNWH